MEMEMKTTTKIRAGDGVGIGPFGTR